MSNLKFTPQQIETLKRQGADYKNWIETDKGKKSIQQHREHERYFKEKLSSENLDKMTDNDFAEVWKKSLASQVWGNKEWYVKNELINKNGIEKLKEGFKLLLYGSENFVNRYDSFRKTISGIGAAMLSESLNMVFQINSAYGITYQRLFFPF